MKRLWVILFVVPIFSQDKLSESSWDSLQIDEEYQLLDGVLLYEEIPKKSFFSKPVTFQIDGEVFFRYLDRKEVKKNIWYNIELFDGTRVYNDGWIEATSLQNKQIKPYKEKVAKVVMRDNKRELKLIGKYGKSIATVILERRIVLGMTREMVLQSIGAPNSQQKITGINTTTTILTYDKGIYSNVVLNNDIVSSFIERY